MILLATVNRNYDCGRRHIWLALFSLVLFVMEARGEQPENVFRRVSPSVVVIHIDNAKGDTIALGSGVIVAAEKVITNCHVVEARKGTAIRVVQNATFSAATIQSKLPESDLCLLGVAGLSATIPVIKPLKRLNVGQRVYAIGAPSGLELTLTEGLISGLRKLPNGETLIQTSAPISPGSSGGGLFSEDGELVGITSFGLIGGNALNFAHAAEYVSGMIAMSESIHTKSDDANNSHQRNSIFRNDAIEFAWKKAMLKALSKYFLDEEQRVDFLETALFETTRAGLDVELVLGMIDVMSQFRKYAMSRDGARGFMLVNPSWRGRIGYPEHNLFNLRTNLRYGCIVLRHYLTLTSGDYYNGLMMYAENNFPKGTTGRGYRGHEFVTRAVEVWKKRWSKLETISDLR